MSDLNYGFVYETINLVTGMRYIGSHKRSNYDTDSDPDDLWYLGSGKYLQNAIHKYGSHNFKRTILAECFDEEDLRRTEEYYLQLYRVADDPSYYNMTYTCDRNRFPVLRGVNNPNYRGKAFTDVTRARLSESRIGKKLSEETKMKLRDYTTKYGHRFSPMYGQDNPFYGKHHTSESIELIRSKRVGTHLSEEVKSKISASVIKSLADPLIKSKLGRKCSTLSETHKRNISKSLTGNTNSLGRKASDHSRELLSIRSKGNQYSLGLIWVTDGTVSKRIDSNSLQSYIEQGWSRGRSKFRKVGDST